MDATETYPLRALSIGEIFDRAITIYVRHLVPLTLIVLTFVVPLNAAQQYVIGDQGTKLLAAIQQLEHPTAQAPLTFNYGLLFLIAAVALLLAPIVNNAVAVGVAGVYTSKAPSYGACFARVFPRIVPLMATTLLEGVIAVGLFIAWIFALTIIVLMGEGFVGAFLPLAIALFVIAGLAYLAFIVFLVMMVIGFSFASYSTVLEDLGPVAAVGSAVRRLFVRGEFRKLLLMSLAFLALQIGVIVLSATVGAIVGMIAHYDLVIVAAGTIIGAMASTFLTVLLAVYYYDVRTRSEGLDLETDLARLTAAS